MEECKSARFSLGTFGLQQLAVAGQMESDGALRCRVSLNDCVLQDTRAGRCELAPPPPLLTRTQLTSEALIET